MKGLLYSLDAVDIKKCARQYPVQTTATMVYRRFVDFAQEILPPARREAGQDVAYGRKVAHTGAWSDGFSIPRIS
ncbi:hypothetical protein SM73_01131 [Klebsiella quasipneumoniae]|nr:hypothetical protein SM73_01131 [Klebsiella quasipneumoniae]